MNKINELLELFKTWKTNNPNKAIFLYGFIVGFVLGAILL